MHCCQATAVHHAAADGGANGEKNLGAQRVGRCACVTQSRDAPRAATAAFQVQGQRANKIRRPPLRGGALPTRLTSITEEEEEEKALASPPASGCRSERKEITSAGLLPLLLLLRTGESGVRTTLAPASTSHLQVDTWEADGEVCDWTNTCPGQSIQSNSLNASCINAEYSTRTKLGGKESQFEELLFTQKCSHSELYANI